MPMHNTPREPRRDNSRRYPSYESESHDERDSELRRRHDRSKYRSSERPRENHRDESGAEHRRRQRSRSPREDRDRMRRERSSKDIKYSRRESSLSRSPPPKRRQHTHDSERDSKYHGHRQRSRSPKYRSRSPQSAPQPSKRSHAPLPSQKAAFTNSDDPSTAVTRPEPESEKQKPNFAPTGKLAAETNTVANTSIVLKYNEPPESRLPPASTPWRLYVFKGKEVLETLPLYERSCWLFGRERAVVDFPTEHPSCSKQHAVLQFRYVEKKNEWGERKGGVKPYLIDLESANGTKINGETVERRRFVQVMSGDVITFGESTREYVLMLPPKD